MRTGTHPALLRGLSIAIGVGATLALLEIGSSIGLHFLEAPPEPPPEVRAQLRLEGRVTATVPDAYLGYRMRSDHDDGHVRTNGFGLRGGPVDAVPAAGVFRVLLLGGSTAWSYTARSEAEALSAVLERELTRRPEALRLPRGWRVEVLNGGVPGYVAWQSALLYALHLRALAPHLVISLDGSNDISSAIRNGEAGVPMRYRLVKRAYLGRPPGLFASGLGWAQRRLQRAKLTLLWRRLDPPTVEELGAPPPAAVAAAYRAALRQLAESARGSGAVAMGVLQPMSHVVEGKPLTPFERAVNAHEEDDMPGRNGYFRACAAAIRAAFDHLGRELPELLLLDGSAAFAGLREVAFADPAHLTPAGRERLAAAIAERLARADPSWWR